MPNYSKKLVYIQPKQLNTRIEQQHKQIHTPQLQIFDDEESIRCKHFKLQLMKQNIQQTAVQRAMQPVARQIKRGLQHFYIHDTHKTIQQQAEQQS